ncbi:alpha-ribazole phosphatase [Actinoallomurus vinaceus]|uniref:Alpha-ribazole phosphatase n=1 Tax=Actinoallomurus vinaceus TaxID=1080074 RepID=A0ABP8UQ55_9ACTN
MTQLALVRHGETEWHAENRYAGISDVSLTARGLEQARQLAAWAGKAGFAAVWTSTLTRAQLTAAPCADAIGVPLNVDERLRELDFGQAEGLTRAEMHERFPEALRAFRADPVADHLPGGEDPTEAVRRFTGCLYDLVDRYPGDRVLVVAHTTAIRLALCELIGVPLRDYRRIFPSVRNCALTEIRLSREEAALLEFNTPIESIQELTT